MKFLHIFRSWKPVVLSMAIALLGLGVINLTVSAATSQLPPQVYINDKYIGFDVNPITVNGHILVPVKNVVEDLGAALTWNESIKTITVSTDATTLIFTIGSYNATVNGKIRSLDEPVQIVEGQTFAPLDFIIKSFGDEMSWDKEKQVVKVYCGSGQKRQMASVATATEPPEQKTPGAEPAAEPPEQKNPVSETTTKQSGPTNPGPATATQQQGPTMAVSVTAADLHIRSGPSTSSDVIGLVPCDTILAYIGAQDDWYQVKYQGQSGWVAGWLVTPPYNTTVPSRGSALTLLPVPSDPEAFVRQMKPYAEIAHEGTGLPVNFLLAQWAEESGYGTSSLAQYYNNFGGIKDAGTGGYRQYSTADEFAHDVIRIYTEHSQYAKLLADARNDASLKTLFNDLSRCGYASSKNYGEKIRTQYLPTIDEILESL